MENGIKKIDTNDLRVNLSRYLKNNKGEVIYITRYNDLIAELKVYTYDIKIKTELGIAQKAVDTIKRKKENMVNS